MEGMNSNLSSFLNLSRWLAALLVVTGHIKNILFVDFGDVTHKSVACRLFYFVSGLGHEAVVIFFVISGFLVGGLTIRHWQTTGPDLKAYAIARFSRIYTVLVPALLLGVLLDIIGIHWFNASALYSNPDAYHIASLKIAISPSIDLKIALGNLLMLENIRVPPLGSNYPLWSLAYEWWYYCIFALVAVALTAPGYKKRIFFGVAALLLAIILPAKLVIWGIIWSLGLAAYFWAHSRVWSPPAYVGFILVLLSLIGSRIIRDPGGIGPNETLLLPFLKDSVIALCYVTAVVGASRMKRSSICPALHRWLADFSYTTYLTHFPLMLFTVAVAFQLFGVQFRRQPSANGMLYFILLSSFVLAVCYLLSRVTEHKTTIIRNSITTLLRNRVRATSNSA